MRFLRSAWQPKYNEQDLKTWKLHISRRGIAMFRSSVLVTSLFVIPAGLAIAADVKEPARSADWPQWLGPKRDGSTTQKIAPWNEDEKPKVLWHKAVGNGYSAPVVAGGRVYVHAHVKDKEAEELIAFDAIRGEEVWRTSYDRPPYKSILGTGPRATPVVAGKHVYTMGINGVVSCFELEKGKQVWQVDAYKQFKAELPRFAVCCSPLVVGNRVIVSVGGKERCVVALHADTGEVQWQALDDAASTSSPILFAGGEGRKGVAADVVFMTPLRLIGLDPLDGTLRWEHPMVFQPAGTSPTPIAVGDKVVASTQAHGAVAVQVGKKDEKFSAEQSWQNKEVKSYFSSGVAGDDLLFLVTNIVEDKPQADLSCLDSKTGKLLWTKEKIGYFHAGVIRTGDGKLLVLSDNGMLSLLEVDAKGARELAHAKVCGGTLVNPALADGKLYARDDKEIVCIKLAE
jgi:outer membrane protein assembly factor BamB